MSFDVLLWNKGVQLKELSPLTNSPEPNHQRCYSNRSFPSSFFFGGQMVGYAH